MRLRRAAIFAAMALTFTRAASAQKSTGAASTPASSTGSNSSGSTNTRQPNSTFPNDSTANQVIFISGTVVLSDGLPLPDRVKIVRACGGAPHLETYTDKKGHFSFQLGQNLEMQDASSQSVFGGPGSQLGNRNSNSNGLGQSGGFNERQLWGCDLKADLPGFRSDILPLSNIHYMDNP
ncbi:MAG: carboxypeptidase-like regulatory domain-containing protein, partial [Acidobacteriota bacterium]|nr:carboxypeptidase-like regulatory domain-containing protein [Acidobacteriota bacterium]